MLGRRCTATSIWLGLGGHANPNILQPELNGIGTFPGYVSHATFDGWVNHVNFVNANIGYATLQPDVEEVVEGFDMWRGKTMEFPNVRFATGVGAVEGGDGLGNNGRVRVAAATAAAAFGAGFALSGVNRGHFSFIDSRDVDGRNCEVY